MKTLSQIQKELEQVKATSRINEAIAEIKATINNKEEQLKAAQEERDTAYSCADPSGYTAASEKIRQLEEELSMLKTRLSEFQKMPLISDADVERFDNAIQKIVNDALNKQDKKVRDLIRQLEELLTDNDALYSAEEACRRTLNELKGVRADQDLLFISSRYYSSSFKNKVAKLSYYLRDQLED